ncbi:MAG: hypothetical protein JRF63_02385 [Deltaproteobacteria bacterium]|nr:hypothetical protein [Deltaproteobacteria bacterium]
MRLSTLLAVIGLIAGFTWGAPHATAETSTAELAVRVQNISDSLGGDYILIGKIKSGGIGKGQTKRFEHVLRPGACYRFVAAGGTKMQDLDLKVFTGTTELAKDVGAVVDPVAHHCVETDTKVEIRLQAFKGHGQYAYGLYAKGGVDQELSDAEAAALTDMQAYAAEVVGSLEQVGEPHVNILGYRNSESLEVLLDRPRCYKFVAVGGSGVTDLSMSVLVDKKEVAGDRISGKKPLAQWCSPKRMRVTIKITMYGGSGPYALGVYGAKASALAAPEKVGGKESDFIANRIRQLHAQYGKGRAALSPLHRGNLSTNSEQVFKVRLTAGKCYTIIAAGNPSAKDVEITLLDSSGTELQKDKTKTNFPVLDTSPCPSFTGKYTVRVKMIKGFGQFGAQVFSD